MATGATREPRENGGGGVGAVLDAKLQNYNKIIIGGVWYYDWRPRRGNLEIIALY